MAYNEALAAMISDSISEMGIVAEEKKMFGGIAYLVGGQMMVGIVKQDLMVRTTLDRFPEALAMPHAREMDFNGKPMKGFLYVAWEGIVGNPDYLRKFIDMGWEYLQSPEGKAAAAKKTKKK